MRIVVSGATGFLGSHIVDELARHDVEVIAVVRPGANPARLAERGIATVEADVTDRDAVRRAVGGASFVVNAARLTEPGHSDAEYDEVNVTGTTNLLDASVEAEVAGFLHLSSTTMYGDSLPHWPVDESWTFRPPTSVEQSRAMAERAARTYRRRIPLVVLRTALAFGPRDNGAVGKVLLHFLDRPQPRLIGGGHAPVSMIYAADLARAVWGAIDHLEETQDRIFHVKSIDTDWRTVLEETYQLLRRRPHFYDLPYRLAVLAQRLGGLGEWVVQPPPSMDRFVELVGRPHLVDDSRLRAAIGFSPLFGLRAALRQTLEWLSEERPELKP